MLTLLALFGCGAPEAADPPLWPAAVADQNALHTFNVYRIYLWNDGYESGAVPKHCGGYWPGRVVARARADGWMAVDAWHQRWFWNGSILTRHNAARRPIPAVETIAQGAEVTQKMTALFQSLRSGAWRVRGPAYYGLESYDQHNTVEVPMPVELPGVHLFLHYAGGPSPATGYPLVLESLWLYLPGCGGPVNYAIHKYEKNPTLPGLAWLPEAPPQGVFFPKTCADEGVTECPDEPDYY